MIAINDPDLIKKSKKTSEKVTENIYMAANEPTLACFRIQEHIHKSGPMLTEKKNEMTNLHKKLKGDLYDVEYSIGAINSIPAGQQHFITTQQLLKNALFLKQQIDYEENIRSRVASKSKDSESGTRPESSKINSSSSSRKSAFQRFSGSFDLPSSLLDLSNSIGLASSASADLKDFKNVLSQLTGTTPSSSPVINRTRASSVSKISSVKKEPSTDDNDIDKKKPN